MSKPGGGYVKLYRKLLDSEVMSDLEATGLFAWCLLKARWQGSPQGDTRRGQFKIGQVEAATEVGVGRTKFRDLLDKLVELGCITMETTNRWTKITVCNYSLYQDSDESDVRRRASQPTTGGQADDSQPTTGEQSTLEEEGEEGEEGENAPQPTLALLTVVGADEIVGSAYALAQEFVAHGKCNSLLEQTCVVMTDLLKAGFSYAEIQNEIRRLDRSNSEAPWDMRRRMEEKRGGVSGKIAPGQMGAEVSNLRAEVAS